jgi:hypothetical protein
LQRIALSGKVQLVMQRSEAEEHLRVIRSLMEKATLYRAISAPTALVGGLLSLVVGGLLAGPWSGTAEHRWWFFGPWCLVLGLTGAANAYFIHRDAQRRGDPFFSPGMRMALKALAPSHVVAGFATLLALIFGMTGVEHTRAHYVLPSVWCVTYGLGLLAMEHFAPRSLVWLGWSFLFAGLAATALCFFGFGTLLPAGVSPIQVANATMALTFGLFHLIYAVCAWPRAGAGGHDSIG